MVILNKRLTHRILFPGTNIIMVWEKQKKTFNFSSPYSTRIYIMQFLKLKYNTCYCFSFSYLKNPGRMIFSPKIIVITIRVNHNPKDTKELIPAPHIPTGHISRQPVLIILHEGRLPPCTINTNVFINCRGKSLTCSQNGAEKKCDGYPCIPP